MCSASEWGELISICDVHVHKHLNIALELYIKELLDLQRNDRWCWYVTTAEYYDPIQVEELRHLFALQNINIIHFANDVYALFKCIDEKRNCLRLIGNSNTCKTLIGTLLVEMFVSAYVNNHNSENEFYLSSFLNKAVCLCEELMLTPATAEDFKSVLGGAKLEISKKYTAKQTLIRTPIIVTSNHSKFGRGHLDPKDEAALANRCYTYRFNIPYKPKVRITAPSLSYLIYVSCTMSNKNFFLY